MLDRRQALVAGALAAAAGPRVAEARPLTDPSDLLLGVRAGADQTSVLQKVIDASLTSGQPVTLPPGDYRITRLNLKTGTLLQGTPGRTTLTVTAEDGGLLIQGVDDVTISGLVIDGKRVGSAAGPGALIAATDAGRLHISNCRVQNSAGNGISLRRVSGRVTDCGISECRNGALFSEDAKGLEIAHNHVHDCGDNGIQVWRSEIGEDGTIVTGNRVQRIRTESGGSGQHGNGISLFRAGSVLVLGNRVSDCAFSAIRGNSAWNSQIIGNSCSRLGEVAIYSEFAFEGTVIANNVVDTASLGISITNSDVGGRLAVCQGNLIRNLTGKNSTAPGVGIAVEADAVLSGNVIENAPRTGIAIGWLTGLRDVTATGNLIRNVGIGISISAHPQAGYALVVNNMITGAKNGAIRAMDGDKPLGSDLTRGSDEAFRNMAVMGNVGLPQSPPIAKP